MLRQLLCNCQAGVCLLQKWGRVGLHNLLQSRKPVLFLLIKCASRPVGFAECIAEPSLRSYVLQSSATSCDPSHFHVLIVLPMHGVVQLMWNSSSNIYN